MCGTNLLLGQSSPKSKLLCNCYSRPACSLVTFPKPLPLFWVRTGEDMNTFTFQVISLQSCSLLRFVWSSHSKSSNLMWLPVLYTDKKIKWSFKGKKQKTNRSLANDPPCFIVFLFVSNSSKISTKKKKIMTTTFICSKTACALGLHQDGYILWAIQVTFWMCLDTFRPF